MKNNFKKILNISLILLYTIVPPLMIIDDRRNCESFFCVAEIIPIFFALLGIIIWICILIRYFFTKDTIIKKRRFKNVVFIFFIVLLSGCLNFGMGESGYSFGIGTGDVLTPQIAMPIEKGTKNPLYLGHFNSLTYKQAKEIASIEWREGLFLTEITSLTPETAKELAKGKGDIMSFDSLTIINSETAKELVRGPGKKLYLNHLTSLDFETAKELANWKGDILSLNGIKSISPEAHKELNKFTGEIHGSGNTRAKIYKGEDGKGTYFGGEEIEQE